MIFLAYIFAIPLAYVATLAVLLAKRDARGIAFSLAFGIASALTLAWSITQSRGSTAGIGFLFLPLVAAVAGFLALAFGRWRSSDNAPLKVIAWVCLTGALFLVIVNVVQGTRTKDQNQIRDDQQEKFTAEISHDREEIAAALQANPGRQRIWLDSAIHANITDRAFLLAALPNDSVSPDVLDTLANGRDLGVTLEAVRNPNTRPETLARVYRTASYPDYFFQALAAHRNTPPEILRELYTRPRTITGLDIWFAGNPSTPKPILADIARKTTDRNVVTALLENDSLDCGTITQLSVNLMKVQNRDADNPSVARLNERLPTVCKNTTP
ncbi:MAG TPA: hypothetical protein VF105_10005 [Gemmatimonadaceae bacterium]